jgi:antirestriction protein ArdC
MKADIYQRVTQQIVAAIEEGAGQYRMPWHRRQGIGTPTNAVSGRAYRGINTLLLWAEASRAGYGSGEWATYRQWTQRGAQVRKGERSTLVILWKPLGATSDENDGVEDRPRGGMLARAFCVFNADQVDGYQVATHPKLPTATRIERAEAFFTSQPAAIWHGSDSAFYDPRADIISMPSFEAFVSPEAFCSVLAHELTHWTGAKARLDRDLSSRFGSEAYAMEELVAELGAAFTVGHLDLACEPRTDHAPYIASWLRVLGSDPRAIVTAAGRAQAAADYLVALSEDGSSPKDIAPSPRSVAQMEAAA